MYQDLTGMKFGRLTVLREDGRDKHGSVKWLCRCECNNLVSVTTHNLKCGNTKSCGCYYKDMLKSRKLELVGKRFGKLTVIKEVGVDQRGHQLFECLCDCGNVIVRKGVTLNQGNIKSCGCYRREIMSKRQKKHGMKGTRIYGIWGSMKDRCFNKNFTYYKDYGGRGITVCNEWVHSFEAFYEWALSNGYNDDLFIDRIDNNGNYEPKNCRWVDVYTQSNNKRNNVSITYKGKTQTMAEWCRELGLDYSVVNERRYRTKTTDPEELFKPVGFTKDMITYKGETRCLREWCKILNLKESTIGTRRRKHPEYTPEQLFAPIKKK